MLFLHPVLTLKRDYSFSNCMHIYRSHHDMTSGYMGADKRKIKEMASHMLEGKKKFNEKIIPKHYWIHGYISAANIAFSDQLADKFIS